jgi:MSHA pilin protein MshC
VVAIPRLTRSSFDEARLFDETQAALRYAQRTAQASQRTVCVYMTSTTVTLGYRQNYGDIACTLPIDGLSTNDRPLPAPGAVGAASTYTVTRQGSATISPASLSFYFDRVGKPHLLSEPPNFSNQVITVGARSMTIEAETGYVH